jgi:hypothetical protein
MYLAFSLSFAKHSLTVVGIECSSILRNAVTCSKGRQSRYQLPWMAGATPQE